MQLMVTTMPMRMTTMVMTCDDEHDDEDRGGECGDDEPDDGSEDVADDDEDDYDGGDGCDDDESDDGPADVGGDREDDNHDGSADEPPSIGDDGGSEDDGNVNAGSGADSHFDDTPTDGPAELADSIAPTHPAPPSFVVFSTKDLDAYQLTQVITT